MRRPNYEIVLRYLRYSEDFTVELPDGLTYCMVDGKVCYQLKKWYNIRDHLDEKDPDELVYVEAEWPINYFIEQCEQLSEEDIFKLTSTVALNEVRRENRPDRS